MSWTYWTADGREAAENSNFSIGSSGPDSVIGYMQDHGANNAAAGHRRCLIYLQTKVMGTGDVPGIPGISNRRAANSIWVYDGLNADNPQTHPRPDEDTTYSVTVGNVTVGGQNMEYSYEVIVFDSDVAGSDFEQSITVGPNNPTVGLGNTYTGGRRIFNH